MSTNNTEHSVPNHPSIVGHIRDLLPLPKHALFHVKLVIHQLHSVPLVSGEFKIKWKFHHLQAVNRAGRPLGLGRALVLKLDGQKKRHVESINANDNGKGKEMEVAHEKEDDVQEQNISTLPLPPIPGGPFYPAHSDRPSSKQSTSSSNSTSTSIFHFNSNPGTPMSENLGIDYRTEARGHTPHLPLRDFKVDFESEINAAVQMSIEKDTTALQASELKLTVMQRVIPNDPESPVNPRLGHVEVNLAEYVDAGPVTRTYLLRRSKVNAMLNMTITMTQISGEERYRAPPLRKEEIKAGISDFLNTSKVPLPSLSQYMPVDDPWLSSSLGQFIKLDDDGILIPQVDEQEDNAESTFELPQPRARKRWRVGSGKRSDSGGQSKTLDLVVPSTSQTPKVIDPLSQKEQLHPTEALIEAVFNPFPSTSDTTSPFTYFVPPALTPAPEPQKQDSGASEGHVTDGTSRGSFDSSRQASGASASDQGHESGSNSARVSGYKWWRRKTGSRPATPSPMDSTKS